MEVPARTNIISVKLGVVIGDNRMSTRSGKAVLLSAIAIQAGYQINFLHTNDTILDWKQARGKPWRMHQLKRSRGFQLDKCFKGNFSDGHTRIIFRRPGCYRLRGR